MIENELIAIWQSSSKHERIKFEKSKLMLEVQSSLDKFDKTTRYWDFMEISIAATLIPFFTYQAYQLPSMLSKFGAILISIWLIYVINNVLKLKKAKPQEDNSYLEYLKENKDYLERHKSFSDKLMYWYVLPCLTGVVMIMIGKLDLLAKSWLQIANTKMVWISLLVFMAIGVFAYVLNKWVVKKEFTPKLKKVNELIQLMQDNQTEI
ncbi:MAG: hypothetical protein RIM83_01055 [Allomuricauda sp.]